MKSLSRACIRCAVGCCLTGAVGITSCTPSANRSDYCPFRLLPERRSGYEIEWTSRSGHRQFEQLCGHGDPEAPPYIHLEVAIVRGTGDVYVGGRLRLELEPRLSEFRLDWSVSCGGMSYVIVIMEQRDFCRVDRLIEKIGQYLRERHASDRVVVQVALWGASTA